MILHSCTSLLFLSQGPQRSSFESGTYFSLPHKQHIIAYVGSTTYTITMSKLFTNTRLRISSACRLYIYVASKLTTSQLRALRTENRREPVVVSSKPVRACIATTEQQLEAVVVGKIVACTTVAGVRLIVTAPEPSERQRAMPPRKTPTSSRRCR